ncbi:MAG: hypothetical protein NTY19_14155 [Planctomycetota bacterium]|nr:hypothetical protein [Planctomycetota bacterium]
MAARSQKSGPEARRSRAYEAAGAQARFTSFIEADTGHVLSETMWQHVLTTFRQYL